MIESEEAMIEAGQRWYLDPTHAESADQVCNHSTVLARMPDRRKAPE